MDSPQDILGVLQSIQPSRHIYDIDFLSHTFPLERVVKHYWAEPLFCSLILFHTVVTEILYITCKSQLNRVSRTTLWQPPLEGTVDILQLSGEKAWLMQVDTNTERHTQINLCMHM